MKVTIEQYIATNNPNQAQAVLAKYGLKARDMSDLIRKMHKLMKVKGEEAVRDFAAINTPYKQLLLSTITPVETAAPVSVEKKSSACGCESSADGSEQSSNACGCSGADGEQTSGCDGCGGKCGGKNKASNVEGDTKAAPVVEAKAEAPKVETKEPTQAPKEKSAPKSESKNDMMPLVIVGVIGLIAVVAIIKS
jgi:hypothetical protein